MTVTTDFFPTAFVDGPPPIAPLYGLLQAAAAPAAGVRFVVDVEGEAQPVEESLLPPGYLEDPAFPSPGRERWINGVQVYPYPPGLPEAWDACSLASGAGEKGFGEANKLPAFPAITVAQPITCTSQQVPDQAAFKARATAVLEATQGYRVERQFMTNELGFTGTPYLADGNGAFPNGDTPTRPNDALQLLEEQIALTGRMGLIHASPMFATALLSNGLAISDKTGSIRTINGIVVIPGFGYAGVGQAPVGHVAPVTRQEWAYATGPVDIRRSAVFTTPKTLAEALDRGLAGTATNDRPNTITYRAERYFVVDWDTELQASVLVDRCLATCGIPSGAE